MLAVVVVATIPVVEVMVVRVVDVANNGDGSGSVVLLAGFSL